MTFLDKLMADEPDLWTKPLHKKFSVGVPHYDPEKAAQGVTSTYWQPNPMILVEPTKEEISKWNEEANILKRKKIEDYNNKLRTVQIIGNTQESIEKISSAKKQTKTL
jgi:hypothetical protein